MGFGFRLDTEEMAELLFNVRLNAHKLKGWRFDATAKMSIQQSLDLTASYIPDGFAQINFRTSAAYIRSDINTENLNTVYNIAFFDTRQELYMSTIHGRSFNLRGGLRHEYASIPLNLTRVSSLAGNCIFPVLAGWLGKSPLCRSCLRTSARHSGDVPWSLDTVLFSVLSSSICTGVTLHTLSA